MIITAVEAADKHIKKIESLLCADLYIKKNQKILTVTGFILLRRSLLLCVLKN